MYKVIIIGLDGGPSDLILKWIKKGYFQGFKRIYEKGIFTQLQSSIPPITACAWNSYITGQNPGKHGVYDFVELKEGSYKVRLTNSANRRSESLWSILSRHKKQVGVINVPTTYPIEEVKGYLISGFDTPGEESDFIFPKDLRKEITKNVGRYVLSPSSSDPAEWLACLYRMVDYRIKVFDYLKDNKPWDFLNVVFAATDQAQHIFWAAMEKDDSRFGNAIFDIYKKIDCALNRWLDEMDEDTILFIMSDHGAGPVKGVVYLNNFLEEQGFLRCRDNNGRLINRLITSCISKALHTGKSVLPQRMRTALKRKFAPMRDFMESYVVFSDIDWGKTKAFSFGCLGSIRINLRGREPLGIVSQGGEYEKIRDEIIEKVLTLKHPETDEAIVDKVYKREEIYNGPFVEKAPDLIIHWRGYEYDSKQRYEKNSGKIFENGFNMDLTNIPYTASHRLYGTFMAYGNAVHKTDGKIYARIEDISPTVLYLHGIPIPETMDGRVLIELFDKELVARNQIFYTGGRDVHVIDKNGYTIEEEAAVEERLKGLGYLG